MNKIFILLTGFCCWSWGRVFACGACYDYYTMFPGGNLLLSLYLICFLFLTFITGDGWEFSFSKIAKALVLSLLVWGLGGMLYAMLFNFIFIFIVELVIFLLFYILHFMRLRDNNKKKKAGIVLVLFVLLSLGVYWFCQGIPFFSIYRYSHLTRCKSNLKTIGTALEAYSADNGGRYPHSLNQLTPRYLPSLPRCLEDVGVNGPRPIEWY